MIKPLHYITIHPLPVPYLRRQYVNLLLLLLFFFLPLLLFSSLRQIALSSSCIPPIPPLTADLVSSLTAIIVPDPAMYNVCVRTKTPCHSLMLDSIVHSLFSLFVAHRIIGIWQIQMPVGTLR